MERVLTRFRERKAGQSISGRFRLLRASEHGVLPLMRTCNERNGQSNLHTPRPLREVAWLFLKLGVIGFGGPAAHIAMMEEEVVRRRRWLTPEEFLDLLGATNLIPGPNSTEMAIHIGNRRAGFAGLLVAGASFILPAMLIDRLRGIRKRFRL